MQSTDIPTKFPSAFGVNADDIRTIPAATTEFGAASFSKGFPHETFVNTNAGGIPPDGRDFNDLGKVTTAWGLWLQAGGVPIGYDATFQGVIGGYPKGAIVASATTAGLYWRSTAENNVTNPDTGGAGWVNAFPIPAITGSVLNLRGSATGGTKTAAWTADQIVVSSSLSGGGYSGSSLALSFNGATTGAGGMDTGSMPTSADLAIYAIFNPVSLTWATLGTVACNGAIYTGSHMPSGYTASALLWAGKTDPSANILPFLQADKLVEIGTTKVLSGGRATSPTGVSFAGQVPAAAKSLIGSWVIGAAVADTVAYTALLASDSACVFARQLNFQGAGGGGAGGGAAGAGFTDIELATPQTIWYQFTSIGATGALDLYVNGYTI